MPEETTTSTEFEEIVIEKGINRCDKVVKGGRRYSYNAVVAVGNRGGKVGYGFGKAREVPAAIEKAIKNARKSVRQVALDGDTIPHPVVGRFGSSRVILIPARPGTGVVAGSTVRAVVELAGIKNILSKSVGSNTPLNLVKATMEALAKLRTKDAVEQMRGVKIER